MTDLLIIATLLLGLSTIATLLSIWLRVATAVCEILIGAIAGFILIHFFGDKVINPSANWIKFISITGAIFLTFLAGTELNPKSLKDNWKEAAGIGVSSFLIPFIICTAVLYYIFKWNINACYVGGIALSTTSVAVIYTITLELGINETNFGKKLLIACFITDFATIIFLTFIFLTFTIKTLIFFVSIIAFILVLPFVVKFLFKRYGNHSSEFETKFLLVCLLSMGTLASWAGLEAVLPAYLIGVSLAKAVGNHENLIIRLRTLTFGLLTPFYFISIGLLVSIPALFKAPLIILFLFLLKMASKAIGIYPVARFFKMRRIESLYTILLMSTGLTFGSIASLFGVTHGFITVDQYSWLLVIIIASAIFPTFAAYIFFRVNDKKRIVSQKT